MYNTITYRQNAADFGDVNLDIGICDFIFDDRGYFACMYRHYCPPFIIISKRFNFPRIESSIMEEPNFTINPT